MLAGAGKIGSALSVDTGRWGGLPAPPLSVQWLRDGVEIAGATGATYMPVDADDRCALACRVTAPTAPAVLAAETAALTVTHVAPELVGGLFDEVFDQAAASRPSPPRRSSPAGPRLRRDRRRGDDRSRDRRA